MAYGGGITDIEQIKEIFYNGIEKVILNRSAVQNPSLITAAAKLFGSQSIVVSIDVKKHFLKGIRVYANNGKTNTGRTPVEFAKEMENAGAGEILLNSIDRDGTYTGYDLPLIEAVSRSVQIPVIAMGGASDIDDFRSAVEHGASAVAAGSMFVFRRPHNAVLISYPTQQELKHKLYTLP
jgi:cyclase